MFKCLNQSNNQTINTEINEHAIVRNTRRFVDNAIQESAWLYRQAYFLRDSIGFFVYLGLIITWTYPIRMLVEDMMFYWFFGCLFYLCMLFFIKNERLFALLGQWSSDTTLNLENMAIGSLNPTQCPLSEEQYKLVIGFTTLSNLSYIFLLCILDCRVLLYCYIVMLILSRILLKTYHCTTSDNDPLLKYINLTEISMTENFLLDCGKYYLILKILNYFELINFLGLSNHLYSLLSIITIIVGLFMLRSFIHQIYLARIVNHNISEAI